MPSSEYADFREKLNSIAASLSVLEHLVLAMFQESPNSDRVRRNFLDVTERSNVEGLFSRHPESFVTAFEETRNTIDQLLGEAIATFGANSTRASDDG